MPRFLAVATVCLALGYLAMPASAASFNCRAASTPTEKAICANRQLSSLDEKIARRYFRLLSLVSQPAMRN